MMDSLKKPSIQVRPPVDLVRCVCYWVPARLGRSKGLYLCMSSRIFYYQNQPVVQKSLQGVKLFSRESKAGPRVRRQSMQKYQGISILFFSRQSKARDQHLIFLTSKQSKCGQDKLR